MTVKEFGTAVYSLLLLLAGIVAFATCETLVDGCAGYQAKVEVTPYQICVDAVKSRADWKPDDLTVCVGLTKSATLTQAHPVGVR